MASSSFKYHDTLRPNAYLTRPQYQVETQHIPYESVHKLQGARALVLAPHPDDEVFGCAGAIIRHRAAGEFVSVQILTDGAYRAAAQAHGQMAQVRKNESLAAASILGYGQPVFWNLPDRGLQYGESLILQIQKAIEACQADLVYAPSVFEIHPDHRALALAAIEAVRRTQGPINLAMYEVGVPMVHPNALLDISELMADKIRAMACFPSQLKEQAYDQQICALNRFRTYTLSPNITAAEAYFLCSKDDLDERAHTLFDGRYFSGAAPQAVDAVRGHPLVSVLIRSMDRALLREALDSVALQTYPNIEVIIVNARKEKHSDVGDMCGRYPLRLLHADQALDRSAAANYAMTQARGDYFVFLDDDDWLDPAHISLLLATLLEHPQAWVAYCGTELRDFKGARLEIDPMNAPFDAGRLRSGNFIPLNAILFSKEVIAKGARFDEGLDVYEDWDFLLQIAEWTAFIHVDRIAAYYRAAGNSGVGLLADNAKKQAARVRIFEKWRHVWSGAQIEEMVTALSDATLQAISSEHYRATAEVLQAKLSVTESLLLQKNEEVQELERTLSASEILLSQSNQEVQDLHSFTQNQREALSRLQKKLDDVEGLVSFLESQIHQKNVQLFDVLNSTSWEVSKPVRMVGHALKVGKLAVRKGIRRILGISRWPSGAPLVSQGFHGEDLLQPHPVDFRPLISVILPVYNACRVDKKFFWHALQSIERQTYKNLELIVVDDGSTDGSRAVYEEFVAAHPGLNTRYITKDNAGQSSARNLGVQQSTGQYVSFIDQDDEWYEDRLEKVIPWLSNPEIDLLYTDADNIDAAGKVTYKSIHKTYNFGWPHPTRQIEDILFKDVIVMPGLMVIKKEKYQAVGGFDVNLSGYEDDDLFLRLFEIGKVFYLPTPTLRWRMYGDNYSFSSRMLKSRLYYWKKLLKNYTNDGRDTFRVRMISMRFFQEFLTQSLAQFQAGNDLYRHSMDGAKEIIPYLPKFPRLVFSIGFALPQKMTLRAMVKASHYFRVA